MIYKMDGGYVISSDGVWLSGVYADERAARYAFRFGYGDLEEINASRGVGDDYRPITFEDLQAWKRSHRGDTKGSHDHEARP